MVIPIASDPWALGIDTSAYTTSIAAVHASGRWIQERQVLDVPSGHRGLRSSEALFQHVRNLPDLVNRVLDQLEREALVAVAVSVAPRPARDSYLPVFSAGASVAKCLASLGSVPLLATTHQEGHIRAGLAGTGLGVDRPFLVCHISGGTTELLSVQKGRHGFAMTLLGVSDDLYAGQMIDRIGVLLGLGFPAGPGVDQLAESAPAAYPIPWSRPRLREGLWRTSFSGPTSHAERALAKGAPKAEVARGVLESLVASLVHLIQTAASPQDLLIIGGVAANSLLRKEMSGRLTPGGFRIWFADPDWSRDNAIGVGYLGLDFWRRQNEGGRE